MEKKKTFYIGYGGCVVRASTAKEALEMGNTKAQNKDWKVYIIGCEEDRGF